jgi:hypothetical protein
MLGVHEQAFFVPDLLTRYVESQSTQFPTLSPSITTLHPALPHTHIFLLWSRAARDATASDVNPPLRDA